MADPVFQHVVIAGTIIRAFQLLPGKDAVPKAITGALHHLPVQFHSRTFPKRVVGTSRLEGPVGPKTRIDYEDTAQANPFRGNIDRISGIGEGTVQGQVQVYVMPEIVFGQEGVPDQVVVAASREAKKESHEQVAGITGLVFHSPVKNEEKNVYLFESS